MSDPLAGRAPLAPLEHGQLLGRRLARARRRVVGRLPTSPERLAGLGPAEEERLDAFLFALGAAIAALFEAIMEPVLLAEGQFVVALDAAEDLRTLEAVGAIPSAEAVLAIRERVRRHHRIPTLPPKARTEALNAAWADGQAMADVLAGLVEHLQRRGHAPGSWDAREESAPDRSARRSRPTAGRGTGPPPPLQGQGAVGGAGLAPDTVQAFLDGLARLSAAHGLALRDTRDGVVLGPRTGDVAGYSAVPPAGDAGPWAFFASPVRAASAVTSRPAERPDGTDGREDPA